MATKLSRLVLWSTIGRKMILALTGLAILAFLLVHLLGNVPLLLNKSSIFNQYAHQLMKMGILLYLAEFFLVLFFLSHVLYASVTKLQNFNARGRGYYKTASAGKPSRKSIASTTMIYTGLFILAFIVIHIKTFKYGPGIAEGYVVQHSGEQVRDLFRLVIEVFQSKWYMIGYTVAMLIMGFHLWHAFGSAVESFGVNHPYYSPILFWSGRLLAIMLAASFMAIPLYIYFTH